MEFAHVWTQQPPLKHSYSALRPAAVFFYLPLNPVWQTWESRLHSPGDIASVGVLRPTSFRLQPKHGCVAELRADVTDVLSGASVLLHMQALVGGLCWFVGRYICMLMCLPHGTGICC